MRNFLNILSAIPQSFPGNSLQQMRNSVFRLTIRLFLLCEKCWPIFLWRKVSCFVAIQIYTVCVPFIICRLCKLCLKAEEERAGGGEFLLCNSCRIVIWDIIAFVLCLFPPVGRIQQIYELSLKSKENVQVIVYTSLGCSREDLRLNG